MNYKESYRKLKRAKIDALANSANIIVGRNELNCALEALEKVIIDNDAERMKQLLKTNF